jgi:hypothetical protein
MSPVVINEEKEDEIYVNEDIIQPKYRTESLEIVEINQKKTTEEEIIIVVKES